MRFIRRVCSAATIVCVGCAGHGRPGSSQPATAVPASAPDSVPEATYRHLTERTNLVELTSGDTIIRNAVWVRFRPGVAPSNRAAAIAAVNGSVIGGWRLSPSAEGFYLIRIPTPRSGADDALAATDRLRALPQVAGTMLYFTKSLVSLVP